MAIQTSTGLSSGPLEVTTPNVKNSYAKTHEAGWIMDRVCGCS